MQKAVELVPLDVTKPLNLIGIGIIAIHLLFLVLIFGFGGRNFYGMDYHFHLDNEINIPSFYSSVILLYSSILLLKNYYATKSHSPDLYWKVLSAVFLYLATDEFLSFHERLIMPIRSYFNLEGYFYYSWILVGAIFVSIVFFTALPFLRRIPKNIAFRFCIAGFIYVTGAIGVEMIGSNEAFNSGYVYGWQNTFERGLTYAIIVTVEETLEICGILYFNYALVQHLKDTKNYAY